MKIQVLALALAIASAWGSNSAACDQTLNPGANMRNNSNYFRDIVFVPK
jgi:hypothetical protein